MKLVMFVLILVTFIQNIFMRNLLDAWKEMIQTNFFTKQKEIHRLWEPTYGCWGEEWWGQDRVWVQHVHTSIFKMWITNEDLLYGTGNSVQCYRAAWMGGEFGGMDTYPCKAESLCCPPETMATLLMGYESESEVAQSFPTLCDPMDCSLPGSSVHGIFQARVLEWLAISFSRGSSRPKDWTGVSHIAGRRFTIWATRETWKIFKKKIFFNF